MGKLLDLRKPVVMGVLNVTPDSFYDGNRYRTEEALLGQAEKMLSEGAAIIDIGGMSSRPGAKIIGMEEELERVLPAIKIIHDHFPEALISIDTVRSEVARKSIENGARMINDISAGKVDEKMYATVADLGAPYVLMHMRGTPIDMQQDTDYEDLVETILDFFIEEVDKLRTLGVKDILLDPGYGFGKTVRQNYELLKKQHIFQMLGLPVLTGISRKSMIWKLLDVNPEEALNGTSVLHLIALQQGAKVLRVHDVAPAVEVIKLWEQLEAIDP